MATIDDKAFDNRQQLIAHNKLDDGYGNGDIRCCVLRFWICFVLKMFVHVFLYCIISIYTECVILHFVFAVWFRFDSMPKCDQNLLFSTKNRFLIKSIVFGWVMLG